MSVEIVYEESRTERAVQKVLAVMVALISLVTSLIAYVFPDPMAYLYTIVRPEYVLILASALVVLLSTSLFIATYLKSRVLFFAVSPLVYLLSGFAFFLIGTEYNRPNLTKGLPKVTSQNGSIYHRGIEFKHQICNRIADTVSCTVLVKNRRGQQNVSAGQWRIVMKNGAVFNDVNVFRGGQKMKPYRNGLDLPQDVEARLEVVFYKVPVEFEEILKLGFKVGGEELGFKNIYIDNTE